MIQKEKPGVAFLGVFVAMSICLGCCDHCFAQEKEDKPDLLELLSNGQLLFSETYQAWAELAAAIEKEPRGNWSRARLTLASALAHKGDFDRAVKILHEGFDWRFGSLDKGASPNDWNTAIQLASAIAENAGRSSTPALGEKVLDQLIPVLGNYVQSLPKANGIANRRTKLIALRCQTMSKANAESALASELARAEKYNEQFPESPVAPTPLIEVMKPMAVGAYIGGEADLEKVNKLVKFVDALRQREDIHKVVWGLQHYDVYGYLIRHLMYEHPKVARKLIGAAVEKLEAAGKDDESFSAMFDFRIKEFKRLVRSIDQAEKLQSIVGTKAAEWDVAEWVNGGPHSLDELSGKVILIDFTAVWCGPCIQLIPELNALHREYGARGLVVVSATEQDDYVWDDKLNSAVKSEESVDLKTQKSVQEKFVAKHKQPFPLMILKRDSKMPDGYGVGSIPHAVLIDRQGNVKLIRTGSTDINRLHLRRAIEQLLSQ